MKKLLLLSAAFLALQAVPVMAQDADAPPPVKEGKHAGPDGKGRGEMFFSKNDTNGDGVISEDEFLANAKKHFDEGDTDKDGKLTKEEAKAQHEKMRAKMKEKREEMKEKRKAVEKPAEKAE